jgi:hypothetical protein
MKHDLLAGVSAAAAFLVILALLGSLWLSAGLALAVYVAVRFLSATAAGAGPSRQREAAFPDEEPVRAPQPRELVNEIRGLLRRMPDPRLRAEADDVCARAAALLDYFAAHPLRAADSQFLVGQYLDLTRTAIERYVAAARFSDGSAGRSAQTLDGFLDEVRGRFAALHERLTGEDDAALAGEIQVLNRTLQDLDEMSLQIRGGNQS